MEGKERYVIGNGEDVFIADNYRKVMFSITTKKLQDLLNQQDKRIKELEQENQQLKQEVEEQEESYNNTMSYLNKTRSELLNLPNKIVGDVADELGYCGKTYLEDEPYIEICIVKGILQTILKKYVGGE